MQFISNWIQQNLNPIVFNKPGNNGISSKCVSYREIHKLPKVLSGTVKVRAERR